MKQLVQRGIGEVIGSGVKGVLATIGGFAISWSNIELALRIASLFVGISVGVVTFISVVRHLKGKDKQ